MPKFKPLPYPFDTLPPLLPLLAPYIDSILPFPDEIVSDMITYAISEGNVDILSKSDKNVDFNILLEHLNPFLGDDAKAVVTKLYKALSGERDSDGIPLALGGGVRSKKIKIVVRNLSYNCDEERLKGFLEHAGCKTWTVDILKDDEGKGRGIAFCEVEERGFEIIEKGAGKLEGREIRVERKREREPPRGAPTQQQQQQQQQYGMNDRRHNDQNQNRFRDDRRGPPPHNNGHHAHRDNNNINNNGRFRDDRDRDMDRDRRDDRRPYESNNDGSNRPKKRSRWGPSNEDTTHTGAPARSTPPSDGKRPRFTSPPQQPKIAKGPSGENAKGFETGWAGRESKVVEKEEK
ncbi:hypothetical protein TrVE_jg1705 [Triparma verrucosa]|uniref:RRM domain-containing protein n=1 Tax=Triparma verrucosa TaxID=1606542 RepID=A0A9W7BFF8_9STRA|nr:hypothetical protein TrVE_jg1705 [Triparma verrucosa]